MTTGTYGIQASYVPANGNFSASSTYLHSGPEAVTIEGASSTTIVGSPSPSTYGQAVSLTASVTGTGAGSPAGTVNFYDTLLSNVIPLNPTPIGLTTNVGSTETATLILTTQENLYLSQLDPNLAEGAHDLIAIYSGTNYANSTSTPTLVQVVFADGTTTTSSVTPGSPQNYGTALSLTATVTNTAAVASVPVGTLTFYDGSTSLGVGTATTTGVNYQVYTLSDSALNAGTHTLTAAFATATSGAHANDYGPSTTSGVPVGYTINKLNTSTAVSVSSASTVFGEAETLSATVTPTAGVTVPLGTVTFRDGSTTGPVLGTAQTTLANSGVATLVYDTLSVTGSPHTIVASFVANTYPVQNYGNSSGTSSPTTVTATKDTTTVTVGVPASQTYGTTVTLSATIVSFYGATPTGTVTFRDGSTTGTVLGTAGVTVNGSGVATTTTTRIDVQNSPHSIFAVYTNTDGNFVGNYNDAIYSATAANTSVSVTSSANPTGQSQLTTFTATVLSAGTTVNEGSVTFSVSSGPDAGFAPSAGTEVGSTNQWTFASSALDLQGTYNIEASYSDAATNFNGSDNSLSLYGQSVATQTTSTSISVVTPTATPVWGEPVTLQAVVTNATLTPVGSLSFMDGIGPVTAIETGSNSTSATFQAVVSSLTTTGLNNLTVHNIYANFTGTGQFGSSSSLPTTTPLQYTKAGTATTVSATPASPTTGTTITFSATVAASGLGEGTPVGTMTFTDLSGPTVLKSGATVSVVGGNDVATFSTAGLSTGLHTIQATFTDTDGFYNNSTSNGTVVVNVAPVAASIAPVTSATSSTLLPQGTDIKGQPAFMKTVTHGQSFNLFVAAFGVNPPSGPIATGYTGVATILLTSESVNGDTLSSSSFSVNLVNGVGTSAALTCVKAGVYLVKVYVPITGAGSISGTGSAFTLQITAL